MCREQGARETDSVAGEEGLWCVGTGEQPPFLPFNGQTLSPAVS